MKYLKYSAALFASIFLCNCAKSSDCIVMHKHKFDGDGILLLDGTGTQDGYVYAKFFPICQVDTLNMKYSLNQMRDGIMFPVEYRLVQRALSNRLVVIMSQDKKRPPALRNLYFTTVHMSFVDNGDDESKTVFSYTINTKQFYHKCSIRVTKLIFSKDLIGI